MAMVWLEDLVPKDHLLRKIDAAVDFDKIYEMVEDLYSEGNGRPSIDPERHIWKDYEELADDARYTPKYADLYKQRKETIQRVFADAKEKHAMRYTPYRGLAQVSNWVRLKFAAMNLKKFAKRKWRDNHPSDFFAFSSSFTRLYAKTPISAFA